MTYGPPPGWNPNQPPPPGPAPMAHQPMGAGQAGNSALPAVGAVLLLVLLVLTLLLRLLHRAVLFDLHWPYTFNLPGTLIVSALLVIGAIMLFNRKPAGRVVGIVAAALDIPATMAFIGGFIRFGAWAVAIATIIVLAQPATGRALAGAIPVMPPMPFAPGQYPPPGPQQFMPQQQYPPQQYPPQQYPQQQFPPQQYPPQPPLGR